METRENRRTNPRRSLAIMLLLCAFSVGSTCCKAFWAPPAYPPANPWGSGVIAALLCGDTLWRLLRFRELTGHWPDWRKRDLGAHDLKKEERKF